MRFDFATVMVLLVAVTGLIWAFDSIVLLPRRRRFASDADGDAIEDDAGESPVPSPPRIVEYARSFFPVFLIVLILRSFLLEPFRIPSGSMMPTLLIGDFILVNKFTYGVRLPVLDRKIVELGSPQRGDVVVFRYPEDPSTPFIKRVVGLPGDRIRYANKQLYINGEKASQEQVGIFKGTGYSVNMSGASLYAETIFNHEHDILIQEGYHSREARMVIPEGHYFVLGDNRDNSRDSRYWGTVPDEFLIGKAFTIWLSGTWKYGIDWSRIGTSIR